jgi:hypothetical protein
MPVSLLHVPKSTIHHLTSPRLHPPSHPVSLTPDTKAQTIPHEGLTAMARPAAPIHLSFFDPPVGCVAAYLSLNSRYSLFNPSACFFKFSKSRSFCSSFFFKLPISAPAPACSILAPSLPWALASPSYCLSLVSSLRVSRIWT